MYPTIVKTYLRSLEIWFYFLLSSGIFILAIQTESLWIDEFVTSYFANLDSFEKVYDLIFLTKGSQTPLHYLYYYAWGQFVESTEFTLRLANLPFFLIGQGALYFALRDYPTKFRHLLLVISALHPMVWQYANEARPYIMMYAGSEMILAYFLHLHTLPSGSNRVSTAFTAIFVVGSILLFGGSMLGGFWVFAALAYAAYFHHRHVNWRYLARGLTLTLVCFFLLVSTLLSLYYLDSVVHGGGASRVSSTNVTTLLFDAYELLGLSGVGPGRLELRESGLASLSGYLLGLLIAAAILLTGLFRGLQAAINAIGNKYFVAVAMAILFPAAIVIISGFVMHWRVLGRHLIAIIPVVNLLYALGLAMLLENEYGFRASIKKAAAVLVIFLLAYSSFSLRFSDRHKKDDYRRAAAIAIQDISQEKRVWWAADGFGAKYYAVPVEYNPESVFSGLGHSFSCVDKAHVNLIANPSRECLDNFSQPNTVILSKSETFDKEGAIAEYLKANNFVKTQTFPAFTIWRAPEL